MQHQAELAITGMTCASCAARIQNKLNRLESVSAQVNYATAKATVSFDDSAQLSDLIAAVAAIGYQATPANQKVDAPDAVLHSLQTRLLVSLIVGVPVIAMSMIPAFQFPMWQWVCLPLALISYGWAGFGFHKAALANLRQRATSMDTLISVGTTAALLWSSYALLFGDAGRVGFSHEFQLTLLRSHGLANIYLESVAGIITFLLLGRWIEARSKTKAGEAIKTLLELGASDVSVLQGKDEIAVPITQLQVGEIFVVRPGEKIATDGIVIQGTAAVDVSLMTGESLPVEVSPGDQVIGATLNTNGLLRIRAERIGADTHLAQLTELVLQAQSGKANVQRLADRISAIFVPAVLIIAVLTLALWLLVGEDLAFAAAAAVAVLIIACPCALGLATPLAMLVGSGRGAQLGIVLKGVEMLERVRSIDTVLLDKTGTVTTGQLQVVNVSTTPGVSTSELLRYAGAAEAGSEHPIAAAISEYARAQVGSLPPITDFTNIPGEGITANVFGQLVRIGRSDCLGVGTADATVPGNTGDVGQNETNGATDLTCVEVAWDGQRKGTISLSDEPRPSSASAVEGFRKLGLNPILLTGDNLAAAEYVAAQVGIDEVIANVLPSGKVAVVNELQLAGHQVAMVGDGVNDAAALAQADLGIAMGCGTDVAIQASDLTLMRSDLLLAVTAIRLSRTTHATIMTNLFWAFAYNIAAIPLAALGFCNPMIAGAAMSFSSIFVVLNSLRIRRFK